MIKKKNVGIITLPLNNYNYGGILQAYALKIYLENLGFNVIHLNRQYNMSWFLLFKTRLAKFLNFRVTNSQSLNDFYLKKFIDSNLNLTIPFYNKDKIESFIDSNKIEVLITGSDQVWRQTYALNIYSDLYLDFKLKSSPLKLSYAASFGKDKLSLDIDKLEIQDFLNNLNAVSVRESAGINICSSMEVNVDLTKNIDPTLLLRISDYKKLIDQNKSHLYTGEFKLVSYVLDDKEETTNFLNTVASRNNLERYSVGKKTNVKKAIENKSQVKAKDSIEQWLHSFATAEIIITDSFHGCVFSILFNKQFITIGNVDRGLSRFKSLLSLFSLEERLVLDYDLDKVQELIETKIDYKNINSIIEVEREKSKFYFEKNLS